LADTAIPRFDSVCIDCPDPAELARFYGAYVSLDPPGGGTAALTFQRAPGFVPPTWPEPAVQQQMHLDLAVADVESAHQRAVALGARHLDTQGTFRVYADPVGHLFCLCSS
jgi:hypothetical protein